MKILLVLPFSNSYQIIPDLGLGYLGSVLQKKGYEVNIIDCVNENIDNQTLLSHIKTEKPDVIGFKLFTKDLPTVKEISRLIKGYNSNIRVIAGGPHPSCAPTQTLEEIEDLDYCFYSDAEMGLCDLVDLLQNGNVAANALKQIPNLVWRDENKQIVVNESTAVENLDSLPFPLWELIDPRNYPPAPQGFVFKSFPTAPMLASRGCPFECTFCCGWRMGGRKIRYRSIDNLISEIKYLHNRFSVNEIHFEDDNFTMRRDYVVEACKAIKNLDFKLHWALPQGVRLNTLDEALLRVMKDAGCYSFSLGIESGSQKILNDMKKRQTLAEIRKKVELIDKVGINTMGFFIIGYPTETIEDIKATISFAKSLPLNCASFNIFKPYPGTEIYDQLKKQNRVNSLDWSTFHYDKVSWDGGNVSRTDIKKLQKYATLSFYLRPIILCKFLSKIRTWGQIKFLAKRIFSVILKKG
ncbi:MAG: hypothetical protein A3G33_03240 [Omnitrophica bacterium RIFCSPLOWO2_12_FULL_44_17]|uniref:Uncharacterized protein n=1 Tax=Candidatus Danuiimicrobium aquiferis TaxID=1801832 RepID=A0A1G1KTP2_9BACT|nr:MAG: hypothetical protein A3B72_06785 [Omnitrophica bacterium RIFCSPHIGHO2_02_FULL_45_28]OGW88535.1 MAG: hypothetical protein A3E74_02035 [Omnitrophica bacterium RIFCSPHIGHO2_12_FULL_44_12]OGW96334.1 MAG: hypothetical protein A3G33_03240 [Omnitrophica bacterium RIFCSPLOWO2_12_FULL_44_17]OGX04858.1 MAG: hypothetical protein A3J12_07895 [Omnitrophica bacterium RIFCSPLOWO2_02_FULL_44_11]